MAFTGSSRGGLRLVTRIVRFAGDSVQTVASVAPQPTTLAALRRDGTSTVRPARTLAVALHDIEPASFERCALMRDWLTDQGVDRVTLLVIPAPDLHPAAQRSPAMVSWLAERRRAGDVIAQHGLAHVQLRRSGWPPHAWPLCPRAREAEFAGLNVTETRRAVEAGWRLLKLAGIEPTGFVAPAYVYTPALHQALTSRFRWWAGLLRVHRRAETSSARGVVAPAWGLGSGPLGRALSPSLLSAGSVMAGRHLRLDLRPADLQHPRHVLAVEGALRRARSRRTTVTYEELAVS